MGSGGPLGGGGWCKPVETGVDGSHSSLDVIRGNIC